MAGEPPELVSSTWPAFGEVRDLDGISFREVTFVAESHLHGDQMMIHLNGITDAHRTDIRPALLDEVPGTSTRVIDYLLPNDLVVSYRFVSRASIPADIGATREGWLHIHNAGRPDPRNERRLPNPLGQWSSILVAPGATEHAAWQSSTKTARSATSAEVQLSGNFANSAATLIITGVTDPRLFVLFDGENWRRLQIHQALERSPTAPGAIVLVPSGTLIERSATLPHPEHAADLLECALTSVRERTGIQNTPQDIVVAGQSYGGLAAANTVALRPDLATTAVVQSGSFHFRAHESRRAPANIPGDLIATLQRLDGSQTLQGRHFVVQSGTEEAGMTHLATMFAAAAAKAGAHVHQREYRGGHDYAWWRSALFDSFDKHPTRADSGER